jgi:flagellar basal body-associated protein FliL
MSYQPISNDKAEEERRRRKRGLVWVGLLALLLLLVCAGACYLAFWPRADRVVVSFDSPWGAPKP